MLSVDELSSLFASFERLQARNATTVASLMFLVLEYLQTLESEVELVWASKLTLVNALFFGARYLGFINIPMLFFIQFPPSPTPEFCKVFHGAILMIMAVSTTCSDAIAYIRLSALTNRSRTMRIYLPLQFAVIYIAFYVTLLMNIRNTSYIPSPYPSQYPCYRIRKCKTMMAAPFLVILISMMSTCIINLFFVTCRYYSSKSRLLRIFYIDGTFSFVAMAAVTLGKVLFHLTGPDEYLALFTAPHQAVHSTAAVRMLLRMRETAHRDDPIIHEGQRLTDLFFTPTLDTLQVVTRSSTDRTN